jgi:hypothetical protein
MAAVALEEDWGGNGKGECFAAPGGQIPGQCFRDAMGLIFGKILEMRRLKIN